MHSASIKQHLQLQVLCFKKQDRVHVPLSQFLVFTFPRALDLAECALGQVHIMDLISRIPNIQYLVEYGYEMDILACLIGIWTYLLKNHRPKENEQKKRSRSSLTAGVILSYIGEHYTEHIQIKDIAEAVSCIPDECCRLLKKTGDHHLPVPQRTPRRKQHGFILHRAIPVTSVVGYARKK